MANDANSKDIGPSANVRATADVKAKRLEYKDREIESPGNAELALLIDIGDRLNNLRGFRKLSTRDVQRASRVKGGPVKISMIERAIFPNLSIIDIQRIADALGYVMEIFFSEKK